MTSIEVLSELARMGDPNTKRTHQRHGAPEPLFGVKVGDLKTIVKRTKKNHDLSLELYDSGNSDAMYLAGLIADEKKMTPDLLRHWAKGATWTMLSEYTVPWIAAESGHGWLLGLEWVDSESELVASAGWSALSCHVSLTPDTALDLPALEKLLDRVAHNIGAAQNRVRYTMNGFVISVGTYVNPLFAKAMLTAQSIGKVSVSMGDTACKVPFAPDYLGKIAAMGKVGEKRKMVRC
jgi:3-methyladenine DNA glycosylase AlkD